MNLLSETQIRDIVRNIQAMLDLVRNPLQKVDSICDTKYMYNRKKYSITGIIYSGFDPKNQNIPGLTIKKTQYGTRSKYWLPELSNKELNIQLYGTGVHLSTSSEIQRMIRLVGDRYRVLQFCAEDKTYTLQFLKLISFSGIKSDKALVKNREIIWSISPK